MSNPEISRMRLYFSRLGTSLVDRFGRGQAEATAGRARANEAELETARTELRRHVEMADAVRGEAEKRSAEAAALREQLATATSEAAQQAEVADRLREQLAAARAEIASGPSRTAIDELTDEAASLRAELARSRGLVSEAVTQRERATQLLRQQIAATAGLQ